MPYTRTVCVSCGQKSPHYLDSFPYFCKEKRNPANLFTFPKCQDKLGGLRVSAQSARQLFYKKKYSGGLFLFVSSRFARRQGGPISQEDLDKSGSPGEGGSCFLRSKRPPGHPAGPAAGCAPGRSGWARGSQPELELDQVELMAEGARQGFHPRMRSRTLVFSLFPLS